MRPQAGRRDPGVEEGGIDKSVLEGMIPEKHKQYVEDVLTKYNVPKMPADHDMGSARIDPGNDRSVNPRMQSLWRLSCMREGRAGAPN